MGLSSKEVSSCDGYGWRQSLVQAQLPYVTTSTASSRILKRPASVENEQQQQQQQQQQGQLAEAVKCPRCESANTKFCYYNNYNKLQPRHFCKACKRHWTKGGTLRNVPVGGARKNSKRLKTTKSNTSTAPSATANTTTTAAVRNQQVAVPFSIGGQALIHPTSFSLLFETDRGDSIGGMTNNNTGTCFIRSTSVSDDHLPVPVADRSLQSTKVMSPTPHIYNHGISTSSSSSFNTTPSSISTSFFGSKQISNGIGFSVDHSSPVKEPWDSTTLMDNEIMTTTSSYWNSWEDIDTFVSTWDHIDSDPIKQL